MAPFFPDVSSAGTGVCGRGHAEAQNCSWGKLNLVSAFLQLIIVRAIAFFGRLNPKATRSS
jgi:hypothetical protein